MGKGKLFTGGKIITMNEVNPTCEAVYVEDGRVVKIGSFEELNNAFKEAEVIDLKGNVMMPGFIEPHAHFDLCSMISKMHNVSGIDYPNTEDVIEQLKKAVRETPKGHWIMCFGLDFLLNRDMPEVNRYWLDEISKEHPIAIIIQSMHTMYINSMGLEMAGINRDTKDTRDGHCIKDDSGEPLGILTEQGFIVPIVFKWLEQVNEDPWDWLVDEAKLWSKAGVTATWVAGFTPLYENHIQLMLDLFNNKGCPIRGDYTITFNSIEDGSVDLDKMTNKDTDKCKMTGIKSWYDGSPYTGNTLMFDNYLENEVMQNKLYVPKDNHGERLFSQKFFYKIMKKYHDTGYQLSIHAQGDQAASEVLEMYAKVLEESPRKDHRHRMEHCAFIRKEDLDLAAKLGITISYHTNHLYYYGEALQELVVGNERTEKMLPYRSSLDKGIKISLHSDAPMYSVNPLRVAGNAVTRKTRNGQVIGPDECISITEALRGITIDAAWQILRDKDFGSIEEGKFADFTVIAEDPYEVDPHHWEDIKIVTTYLSGEDTETLKYE